MTCRSEMVYQLSNKARRNCGNIGIAQVAAASWANSPSADEESLPSACKEHTLQTELIGLGIEKLDLQGKVVVSGFIGSHVHLVASGLQMGRVELRDVKSQEDFVQKVKEAVRDKTRGEWVFLQVLQSFNEDEELPNPSLDKMSEPSKVLQESADQDSPSNRVLFVTIHTMIYPITKEVLHQVFSPYGFVEKIVTVGFQALIQFQSQQNAVEAMNSLQGRCIYDGCCRLAIQFSYLNDLGKEQVTKRIHRGSKNLGQEILGSGPKDDHQTYSKNISVASPASVENPSNFARNKGRWPPGSKASAKSTDVDAKAQPPVSASAQTETSGRKWKSHIKQQKEQDTAGKYIDGEQTLKDMDSSLRSTSKAPSVDQADLDDSVKLRSGRKHPLKTEDISHTPDNKKKQDASLVGSSSTSNPTPNQGSKQFLPNMVTTDGESRAQLGVLKEKFSLELRGMQISKKSTPSVRAMQSLREKLPANKVKEEFLKAVAENQAESKILKGPHEDLESYLEAIDQLRANVRFFNSNKSLKSSDGLLNHANNNVRFFNSNKSLKSSDGLLNHANNMLMLEFISDGNSQQQTYFLHT
ncbi:uncharacterized protein A4U43_C03F25010 [Asparagus officinalis]|uniref:RRM domain-containing protein n=1 Tax=Asparagus officinalis TaxID=4686 RepID=A0A5P1FHY9_ASPOF|nr:uncharacterized protein A4U43_C03F25010 [Asparagus officinalis]